MPANSEVRCRYRRKIFECYDTVTGPVVQPVARPTPVVAVPAASTAVVETTTTTTTTEHMSGLPDGMITGGISMAGPDGEALSVGMNISGMGATVAGPDGEMVSVDMNMDSMGATIAGPDGEMVSVGMNIEGLGTGLRWEGP